MAPNSYQYLTINERGISFISVSNSSGKQQAESSSMIQSTFFHQDVYCRQSLSFTRPCNQAFVSINARAVMADEDNEFERPRKIPKTLKEKDTGKRLIVILEKASLETVKVLIRIQHLILARY